MGGSLEVADEKLIELIKTHGKWVDPQGGSALSARKQVPGGKHFQILNSGPGAHFLRENEFPVPSP